MLNISKEALLQLKEYKERRGADSYIRIGILSGSTTGPSLGVSVDEKTEKDELISFDELDVIVDKALLEYCERIDLEYVLQEGGGCSSGGGFKIKAKKPL